MQFSLGVFIGRFQPVHHGHIHVIIQGLQQCQRLIVLIGSIRRARSVKNPWSYEERVQMLTLALQEYDQIHHTHYRERIIFQGIEDQMYNDAQWFSDVNAIAKETATTADQKIAVIGHYKDASTWYLAHFPHWPLLAIENYQQLNATPIRHAYFTAHFTTVAAHVSQGVIDFLQQFSQTSEYHRLKEEYYFLLRYRQQWAHTPYPPIFVTTDSIVTCQNHLLLIRRGHHPGKGLWALPGGFLEVSERIQTGLLRELREETSIDVSDETLKKALKTQRVFDHPDRAQVGRVITHAGWFDLSGDFPNVHAADDAAAIQWYPLDKIREIQTQLHDDHYYIIKQLLMLT